MLVSFRLDVGGCALYGQGPAIPVIRVVHQDSSGHRLGREDVDVDAGGEFSIECLPGGPVKSGHRLVAKDSDGATLRTLVVPPFSFRIDRATDKLSISGPPSANMSLIVDACYPGYPFPTSCDGEAVALDLTTHPSTGKYAADLVYDVRGGDQGRMEWTNPSTGDHLRRDLTVPYLQVERGSARVKGAARPDATVHLELRRSNGTLRDAASDKATYGGAWSARFRKNGSDVDVATGNRVKGDHASNGVLDVVATGASINLAADTAHVTCLPNGRYGFTITHPTGNPIYRTWGVVGPSGTFDATGVEVESGWVARLWCASRKGDVIYRRWIVP